MLALGEGDRVPGCPWLLRCPGLLGCVVPWGWRLALEISQHLPGRRQTAGVSLTAGVFADAGVPVALRAPRPVQELAGRRCLRLVGRERQCGTYGCCGSHQNGDAHHCQSAWAHE